MTAVCHPLPGSVVHDFLQEAARTLCDRPGDTAAQKVSRTHRMVHTIMGFQPRDGLEYMLSTLALGQFDLILDSMRDVFQGQVDTMKAKTKSGVVALERSLRGALAELRRAGERPLAEDARQAAPAETAPIAAPAAPATAPDPSPVVAAASPAVSPMGAPPVEVAGMADRPAAGIPPALSNPRPAEAPDAAHLRLATPAKGEPPADGGGTPEENLAALREAWETMQATLEEAQAYERAHEAARAASGD